MWRKRVPESSSCLYSPAHSGTVNMCIVAPYFSTVRSISFERNNMRNRAGMLPADGATRSCQLCWSLSITCSRIGNTCNTECSLAQSFLQKWTCKNLWDIRSTCERDTSVHAPAHIRLINACIENPDHLETKFTLRVQYYFSLRSWWAHLEFGILKWWLGL